MNENPIERATIVDARRQLTSQQMLTVRIHDYLEDGRDPYVVDEELIAIAKQFAFERHAGQMYGARPYTYHLEMVVAELRRNNASPAQICAGWLHDTIEDTGTKREEIAQKFGPEVELLVWAVTGQGETRAECLEDAARKIAVTPGAGALKGADRYSHVRTCLDERLPKFLRWYVDEHPILRPVLPECELTEQLDAHIELARAFIERQPSPQQGPTP